MQKVKVPALLKRPSMLMQKVGQLKLVGLQHTLKVMIIMQRLIILMLKGKKL